jgi:hypothetical protein
LAELREFADTLKSSVHLMVRKTFKLMTIGGDIGRGEECLVPFSALHDSGIGAAVAIHNMASINKAA